MGYLPRHLRHRLAPCHINASHENRLTVDSSHWTIFPQLYDWFPKTNEESAMSKLTICLAMAASLAACGGGSGDAAIHAAPSVEPVSSGTSTPPVSAPLVTQAPVLAPVMDSNLFVINANATMTVTGNDREFAVKTHITSNLILKGNNNKGWLTDNQTFGVVTLDGSGNTIIFRPGTTASELVVNGANGTIYLPVSSPIRVTGTAAEITTVRYYQ